MLTLLGLGLAALGAVFLFCPGFAAPLLIPPASTTLGLALLIVGGILALGAFTAWLLLGCPKSRCDWLAFGWQALFITSAVVTYAGFCPGCSWLLLGGLGILVAVALFIYWTQRCQPSTCKIFGELLFVMIAFDVTELLEMALGWCVLISNPTAAVIWGLAIAIFNGVVYSGLSRNNCIRE